MNQRTLWKTASRGDSLVKHREPGGVELKPGLIGSGRSRRAVRSGKRVGWIVDVLDG
jgi:hypothetical protein